MTVAGAQNMQIASIVLGLAGALHYHPAMKDDQAVAVWTHHTVTLTEPRP
jgi:hypothetical protein